VVWRPQFRGAGTDQVLAGGRCAQRRRAVASDAASKAGDVAKYAVRQQVCQIAADGQVTGEEAAALHAPANADDQAQRVSAEIGAARSTERRLETAA
jgi:hypothetical protein